MYELGEPGFIQALVNKIKSYVGEKVKTDVPLNAVFTDTNTASEISINDLSNNYTSDNVEGALEEVFTDVSNGKNLVAVAITDKGVPTTGNDTFNTMATNISSITSGGGGGLGYQANDIIKFQDIELYQESYISIPNSMFIKFDENSNVVRFIDRNNIGYFDLDGTKHIYENPNTYTRANWGFIDMFNNYIINERIGTNHTVYKFDSYGNLLFSKNYPDAISSDQYWGIVNDSEGNIIISDGKGQTVYKYDNDMNLMWKSVSTQDVYGISVDNEDSIYITSRVAARQGTLKKVDKFGVEQWVVETGSNSYKSTYSPITNKIYLGVETKGYLIYDKDGNYLGENTNFERKSFYERIYGLTAVDNYLLSISGDGYFYGFNIHTGELAFSMELNSGVGTTGIMDIINGMPTIVYGAMNNCGIYLIGQKVLN